MFPVGFVTDHRIEGDKHFVHQGDGGELGLCPAATGTRSATPPAHYRPSPRPFRRRSRRLRTFLACIRLLRECESEEAARDPPVHEASSRRAEGAGDRANSGIGEATAIALGRAGADVVVNYVEGEAAPRWSWRKYAGRAPGPSRAKPMSRSEDQVARDFRRAVAELRHGRHSGQQCRAAAGRGVPDMNLEQWNKVMGVNLTGQFLCAREAVREFLRRGVVKSVSCRGREDRLHQLRPRDHPMGRPRQLRRLEGRRADDGKLAQEVARNRSGSTASRRARSARRSTPPPGDQGSLYAG